MCSARRSSRRAQVFAELLVNTLQIAALCGAAFVAGTVDAIAGGGGLITVPALLWAMPDPTIVLGTNKGQSAWGSLSALIHFWRKGFGDLRRAPFAFASGFTGSLIGAHVVLSLPRNLLRGVVLTLLVAVAVVLTLRRELSTPESPVDPTTRSLRTVGIALAVGAYDGFFGPGTGTFLIMAFVALLGDALARASANAKVVNFASNLAAVLVFALKGRVLWAVAIPMACFQMLGGAVGARMTIHGGDRFVRRVVLAVVTALVARLAWDLQHPG